MALWWWAYVGLLLLGPRVVAKMEQEKARRPLLYGFGLFGWAFAVSQIMNGYTWVVGGLGVHAPIVTVVTMLLQHIAGVAVGVSAALVCGRYLRHR